MFHTNVDKNGKISLPEEVIRKLNLREGVSLTIRVFPYSSKEYNCWIEITSIMKAVAKEL